MTKIIDGSEVDKGNYIPVDKDKLKEDQQNELRESVDRYERECLQPLTEAQRENKMIDAVYQAVGQAFIKSAVDGECLRNGRTLQQ